MILFKYLSTPGDPQKLSLPLWDPGRLPDTCGPLIIAFIYIQVWASESVPVGTVLLRLRANELFSRIRQVAPMLTAIVGTVLLRLRARDRDIGRNARIVYEFSQHTAEQYRRPSLLLVTDRQTDRQVVTAHCRAVQETQAASCDRQTDRQTGSHSTPPSSTGDPGCFL